MVFQVTNTPCFKMVSGIHKYVFNRTDWLVFPLPSQVITFLQTGAHPKSIFHKIFL